MRVQLVSEGAFQELKGHMMAYSNTSPNTFKMHRVIRRKEYADFLFGKTISWEMGSHNCPVSQTGAFQLSLSSNSVFVWGWLCQEWLSRFWRDKNCTNVYGRRNYFRFSYLRHFHGHLLKAGYRLLTEKELQYTYRENILTDNTMATIPVQF